MKTMTENNPPFYQSVMDDLGIDPEMQTLVSHEERLQEVLNRHRSALL